MNKDKMLENINSWVDDYCERHNVKKEAIAESINIGRSTFYVKLSGKTDFGILEAYAMSELFGCSIDELLESRPNPTN